MSSAARPRDARRAWAGSNCSRSCWPHESRSDRRWRPAPLSVRPTTGDRDWPRWNIAPTPPATVRTTRSVLHSPRGEAPSHTGLCWRRHRGRGRSRGAPTAPGPGHRGPSRVSSAAATDRPAAGHREEAAWLDPRAYQSDGLTGARSRGASGSRPRTHSRSCPAWRTRWRRERGTPDIAPGSPVASSSRRRP